MNGLPSGSLFFAPPLQKHFTHMRISRWPADLLSGPCRSTTAPMPTRSYPRLRYLSRIDTRPHSSGFFDLPRPSAELAVAACGGSFGRRGYTVANFSMFGGDPTLRPQEALQQRGQVNVRIEIREMNSEARWRDFDCVELIGFRAFEPLGIAWPKRDLDAGAKPDHHAIPFAFVLRACRARGVPQPGRSPSVRRFKFVFAHFVNPRLDGSNVAVIAKNYTSACYSQPDLRKR